MEFEKVMKIGKQMIGKKNASTYVRAKWDGHALSIVGVIGPLRSGDCRGNAGQIYDELSNIEPDFGWTREMVDQLQAIWRLYHLNDTHAECVHQRAIKPNWGIGEQCPVCFYPYGSQWLYHEVPGDVLATLNNYPESPDTPAWI